MAWYTVNTKELWTGETHEFLGKTYSGATRTPSSTRLEEGPEPVKARTKKGTFKSGDPSTPNVDESKTAPKKKTATKKKAAK